MKTFFYGQPAYVQLSDATLDTTRPAAVELSPDEHVRVVPFDNTPPFFLESPSPIYLSPQLCAIEIPRSPFRYPSPKKILAILRSCNQIFRVVDDGDPVLETDDGSLSVALPRGVRDVRLRCGSNQGVTTCALSAKLPSGQYLMVAAFRTEWEILINAPCVRAEQRNGATLILSDLSPSGLIGTVTVYDSSFKKAEEHPVYTGDAATQDPVLLLYDYLALHLDDKARTLLSSELLSEMPYPEVVAFFGRFKSVLPAPGAPSLYAAYTDDTHAELYRAELKDGMLVDLVDAEHPLDI